MSVTTAVSELVTTISAIVAPHGYVVAASDDPIAAGAGGIVMVSADVTGSDGVSAVVAIREDLGDSAETLARSVAEVVAGGELTVAIGAPVGDIADLLGRLTGPLGESAIIQDGDTLVGAVLIAGDRRAGADAGGPTASVAQSSVAESAMGQAVRAAGEVGNLDLLRGVYLDVSVELGRSRLTLDAVMSLDIGSVVELNRTVGSPVDIRVNGTLLARGEVVVIDEEYAVRVTEVIDGTPSR